MNKYTTLRAWKSTVYKLKLLAAIKDDSMITVLDRLISNEFKRLNIEMPKADAEDKND